MFRSWGLLKWYGGTFRSRETTIELLKPELEDGILAPSDFDKAVDFLPRKYRTATMVRHGTADLPVQETNAYSFHCKTMHVLSGAALSVLLRKYMKRRTALFAGIIYGAAACVNEDLNRIMAHQKFESSLTNPAGFSQALENVQIRQGNLRRDHRLFTELRAELEEKIRKSRELVEGSEESIRSKRTSPSASEDTGQSGGDGDALRDEGWVIQPDSDKGREFTPSKTSTFS
jgi:hypothetical protein